MILDEGAGPTAACRCRGPACAAQVTSSFHAATTPAAAALGAGTARGPGWIERCETVTGLVVAGPQLLGPRRDRVVLAPDGGQLPPRRRRARPGWRAVRPRRRGPRPGAGGSRRRQAGPPTRRRVGPASGYGRGAPVRPAPTVTCIGAFGSGLSTVGGSDGPVGRAITVRRRGRRSGRCPLSIRRIASSCSSIASFEWASISSASRACPNASSSLTVIERGSSRLDELVEPLYPPPLDVMVRAGNPHRLVQLAGVGVVRCQAAGAIEQLDRLRDRAALQFLMTLCEQRARFDSRQLEARPAGADRALQAESCPA